MPRNHIIAIRLTKKEKEIMQHRARGATPYFKLRKDVRGLAFGHPAWTKMVHALRENPEEYKAVYHQRSNIETSYAMFKRKVSAFVRSKNTDAQINEALCIAIVHNLFVVVNAVFCLNLDPTFKKA